MRYVGRKFGILSLNDAYKKINNWVSDFNHYRPCSSLNKLALAEYVQYYQNKLIVGKTLPETTGDVVMFIKTTKFDKINQKNITLFKSFSLID